MDFWIISLILASVAGICFYLGYRIGYAKSEADYTLDEYHEEENLP